MRPRVRPHLKPHARIVKRYLSSLYSSDVYIGADFEMTMGDWVRVDGRWVQPEVESPCRFCHPTENAEDWSLKPGYIYDGSICVQAPSAETWQETATLAGASLSVPHIACHCLPWRCALSSYPLPTRGALRAVQVGRLLVAIQPSRRRLATSTTTTARLSERQTCRVASTSRASTA